MSRLFLKNPFDSHVHWEATGSMLSDLDLSSISGPDDLLQISLKEDYKRGDWIVGFGWDESKWKSNNIFDRHFLDRWSPKNPVLLERADRHAAVANTEALRRAGLLEKDINIKGGSLSFGSDGLPTGFLVDKAMDPAKKLIPKKSQSQVKRNLLLGRDVFNTAGYTHIRDLTCNEIQFAASLEILKEGALTLAVEQYFDCRSREALDSVISMALSAQREAPALIRVKGIKIFYDGSLGSEGALLSQPYYGCGANRGFRLYEPSELQDMIERVWRAGLEVAIHAIGDQGAHEVVESALAASKSVKAKTLHIEHAELLRPDTIEMMSQLDVVCHMQPCHWLTDKRWTEKKLGPLAEYLFRWHSLEQKNLKFDFGSDAPIENSSIFENVRAVRDAAENGIPAINDIYRYMQHPDELWVPGCNCEIENDKIRATTFANRPIIRA